MTTQPGHRSMPPVLPLDRAPRAFRSRPAHGGDHTHRVAAGAELLVNRLAAAVTLGTLHGEVTPLALPR